MIKKDSFLQNFGGNLQQVIGLLEENFLKEIEEIQQDETKRLGYLGAPFLHSNENEMYTVKV